MNNLKELMELYQLVSDINSSSEKIMKLYDQELTLPENKIDSKLTQDVNNFINEVKPITSDIISRAAVLKSTLVKIGLNIQNLDLFNDIIVKTKSIESLIIKLSESVQVKEPIKTNSDIVEVKEDKRNIEQQVIQNDIDVDDSQVKLPSTIDTIFSNNILTDADGQKYTISQAYVSRAKLVAGDSVSITFTSEGPQYKCTNRVNRIRVLANIVRFENRLAAEFSGKVYRILTASTSYYKVKEGDEVLIVLPADKAKTCSWAVIDSVRFLSK